MKQFPRSRQRNSCRIRIETATATLPNMKIGIDLTRSVVGVAILLIAVAGLSAQKKEKRSRSALLIKSNVLVLDAAGQYVDDVRQEDLKIFENGIEQKISYFSKKDPGSRICIVIDNSGSMNKKAKLAAAIGKSIVDNLGTKDESTLIRFVSREKITIEEKWTPDKKLMHEALDNLFIEGGQSAVVDAVYLAFEMMQESESKARSQRHAIIVITDGDDRDSYYAIKDLRKIVGEADVQVFIVAFTGAIPEPPPNDMLFSKNRKEAAEKLLGSIAAITAGIPYFFDESFTQATITDALRSLMLELRSQFVVGYSPTDKKDRPRKLSVVVADGPNGEKRKALIRESGILPVD